MDIYSGSFFDDVEVKYLVMEKRPFSAPDC